jgi:hypothetical protein
MQNFIEGFRGFFKNYNWSGAKWLFSLCLLLLILVAVYIATHIKYRSFGREYITQEKNQLKIIKKYLECICGYLLKQFFYFFYVISQFLKIPWLIPALVIVISFLPVAAIVQDNLPDLTGTWQGMLSTQNEKASIEIYLAKMSDGKYSGITYLSWRNKADSKVLMKIV